MHICQSMSIQAETGTVFRWIETPELARRWQADVVEYEITKMVPGVVGTEFRELLGDSTGSLELRGRIIEYLPGSLITFDLHGGGMRIRSRYVVRPEPPGAMVRTDVVLQPTRLLASTLTPLIRRRMARHLRAELETLRMLCEVSAGDVMVENTATGPRPHSVSAVG